MKVIIATGGTGGHIYPAIAVARELQKAGDVEVLFTVVGREVEKEIFSKEGFETRIIPSSVWYGNSFYKNIIGCGKIVGGVLRSVLLMRAFKPDVVLLMGGYMSVPVAVSGYLLRVPMVVHEQNLLPGLAVRLLSKMATKVAVSYRRTLDYLRNVKNSKVVVTGNPVRFSAEDVKHIPISQRDTLLVFGGSQGSSLINRVMVDALKEMEKRGLVLNVFHITGRRDYNWIKDEILAANRKNISVSVVPYFHDILKLMCNSRLVISRAGASTISEISVVGRASILIPFAAARGGHQYHNARVLADRGAAVIIREEGLSSEKIVDVVEGLFFDEDRLRKMEQASRSIAKPDAAKKLANILREVAS